MTLPPPPSRLSTPQALFQFPCQIIMSQIVFQKAPGGKPKMSDVFPLSGISGLSFYSTLLSHLLFFCLVLLLFLSLSFPFQKILQYFSLRDWLFLYGFCLAANRSKMVCGMCGIGIHICSHIALVFAVLHLYIFVFVFVSVHSFFILF